VPKRLVEADGQNTSTRCSQSPRNGRPRNHGRILPRSTRTCAATFQRRSATNNPGREARQLLAATQKVLCRVLFIAFCEDRPTAAAEIVARAYKHTTRSTRGPCGTTSGAVSRWMWVNPALRWTRTTAGCIAPDAFVDALAGSRTRCARGSRNCRIRVRPRHANAAKLNRRRFWGTSEAVHFGPRRDDQQPRSAARLRRNQRPDERKKEGRSTRRRSSSRYIVRETPGSRAA